MCFGGESGEIWVLTADLDRERGITCRGGTSFASPRFGRTFHHGILPNDINIVLNRLPAKCMQFQPHLQTRKEKKIENEKTKNAKIPMHSIHPRDVKKQLMHQRATCS